MKPARILPVALFAAVLASSSARADEVSLVSIDDLLKKRGTASALLVVVAKEDADEVKTVGKLLGDPKLAKLLKDDVPAARLEPGDEEQAKKLGIPVEKATCLLAFDGYGIPSARHAKALSADTLASLVKQAQDATKKKKQVEKKLDAAVATAEKTMKSDSKTACEQFLGVVAMKPSVPCGAVTTAEKRIDELSGKGLAILTQAKAALDKKDFSKTHKLISEAQNTYPTPAVLDQAKSLNQELAIAEKNASGK
jgi:hypothetical protein